MPDPPHKTPGFYEAPVAVGSEADHAAVATAVEAMNLAVSRLDLPAIRSLSAPWFVCLYRDGRFQTLSAWLKTLRQRPNINQSLHVEMGSITVVSGHAVVATRISRADGDLAADARPAKSGIKLKDGNQDLIVSHWMRVNGTWLRASVAYWSVLHENHDKEQTALFSTPL